VVHILHNGIINNTKSNKKESEMEIVTNLAMILAVVGALNWGLVGIFKFDLVAFLTGAKTFGSVNSLSRLVYLLVAVSGGVAIATSGLF
jgi:uncharacterized membrane protein YuzA (DUF378 family)